MKPSITISLTALWRIFVHTIRHLRSVGSLKGLSLVVDDKTLAKRLTACQLGCDRYLPGTRQCGVCTCYIDLKARLVTEDCPHPVKNHWNEA